MQELMTKLVGMIGNDLTMKIAALVVADLNLLAVASVLIQDEASAHNFIATFTPKPGGKVTTVHCGDRNTLYFGCSWGGPPSGQSGKSSRNQKKAPEPWVQKEGKPYLADCWATIFRAVKKAGNAYSVPEGTVQKGRDWADAGSGTCKILADGEELPPNTTAVQTSKLKGGQGPVGFLCLPTAVYRKGVEAGLIEKDESSQAESTEGSSGSPDASGNPFETIDYSGINL